MKKNLLILSVVFAFGLIVGLFFGTLTVNFLTPGLSRSEIAMQIKDLYELSSGMHIERVEVARDGWLYKATIYVLDTEPTIVYVSLDGNVISENTLNAKEYKKLLDGQKRFIDCLYSKGLKIYSSGNESTQLQILGGGRLPRRVFVDCTECSVPSISYNNKTYEGIKQLDWFESTTGCEF
ncbi:MAG: hypothetical protein V1900_02720 [Candidatus Aenigmatarchaeota archaeon]